jgi:hypothetical protein
MDYFKEEQAAATKQRAVIYADRISHIGSDEAAKAECEAVVAYLAKSWPTRFIHSWMEAQVVYSLRMAWARARTLYDGEWIPLECN